MPTPDLDHEIPKISPHLLIQDAMDRLRAPIHNYRPMILTGEPGVGKTTILEWVCRKLGIPCWTIRPVQHESVEFTGLPFVRDPALAQIANCLLALCGQQGIKVLGSDGAALVPFEVNGSPVGEWVPFDALMPTDPDWEGMILLDEMHQADQSMQKIMASLVDRKGVAGSRVPAGARFVLCGNRKKDRAGAGRLISIIESRARHAELVFSLQDWDHWALRNNIDDTVRSFGQFKGNQFTHFDPSRTLNPLARTWHFASDEIKCHPNATWDKDDPVLSPAIRGIVGPIGTEFMAFRQHFNQLHGVVDAVFKDPDSVDLQDDMSVKHALVGAITQRVKERNGSMPDSDLVNVYSFAKRCLPTAMQALVCVGCLHAQAVSGNRNLMAIAGWQEWFVEHQAVIEAWKTGA